MSLITGKWARIAPLAHIIHSAPDGTKGGQAPRQTDGYTGVGYRYRYTDVSAGSPVENPWRFSEHRPSGINNIEVEPVYKRA
jgi:hypothetical protein